ncbi:MAG: hydantoinase/oxoprolinase family protein [Alphaproteobacteria bacterium]|nr:hydantoinase/oxoprolinase family protein [Alphaproteobacteria bacterium]
MFDLGVDTGGTFTDFVLFDRRTRAIRTFKTRSVPKDPGAAVDAGLRRMKEQLGVPASAIERFVFGTTVATNAVLERKGAATALVTTAGMRDVLEIQRQWRHRLFDLYLQKPEPLVPRRWRIEAAERVTAQGEVLVPLEDAEIERVVEQLSALPVEAVAICFLFSFLRPEHEQRLGDAIGRRLPRLAVTMSSDVSPEFREYERTATTVMNAYTMPKIAALAARLDGVLKAHGFAGSFGIMQSNGGLMTLSKARTHPVHTLLSGPAGGVVGAVAVAKASGIDSILGFDVGGTSTDIALVEKGEIKLSPDGGIAGYPVKVPQIRIHTIGAGGGSIARPVLGLLKVGPQSAGADPGPVCYGAGGAEPTGTDAALCLGYIDPGYFLGGEMRLDKAEAERALASKVAAPLAMDVAEAALAVLKVQVSSIVAGIRKVSVEAGHDPREFALLPFGGAGGIYAGLVAEEAGMRTILIPQYPSVLSALGMIMTDVRHTRTASRRVHLDRASGADVARELAALVAAVDRDMAAERLPADRIAHELSADLRYVGQAYEINVRIPATLPGAPVDLAALRAGFNDAHRRLYGHAAEAEPVEVVNLRVSAIGRVDKAALAPLGASGGAALPPPKSRRKALFDAAAGWQDCPVYERESLPVGAALVGPAIIEDRGSSIPLWPKHRLEVDGSGNMIVDVTTVAARKVARKAA